MKKKITANILFSGIGCQEMGFKNSGVYDLEVVNTSEIDKEAILSYAIIHCGLSQQMIDEYEDYPDTDDMIKELEERNIGYKPETGKHHGWEKYKKNRKHIIQKYWLAMHLGRNLGDISKIQSLSYADLWTISFPCQSISCAGDMKGFKPNSGTKSSLLWENIRLLKQAVDDGIPPKYLMFENVKNLVSSNFMPDFLMLLDVIEDLGFNSYWKVLNAKHCGVPQNRERVFVVCVRKDIDTEEFRFPMPHLLDLRLKDILEDDVDEKYYITGERKEMFIKKLIMDGKIPDPDTLVLPDMPTQEEGSLGTAVIAEAEPATTPEGPVKTDEVIQIGNVRADESRKGWKNPQAGRVYDANGICPTLNTMQGGCRQPIVLLGSDARKIQRAWAVAQRGRYTGEHKPGAPTKQKLELHDEPEVSNTITTIQKDFYTLILKEESDV